MQPFHVPTAADRFEYLLRLYFGEDPDRLACCIGRAYRDLNRTLHGVARLPEGEGLRDRASLVVRSFLTGSAAPEAKVADQAAFDARHRAACFELGSTYAAAGFAEFRVGQAQKWLNMALKYALVFGEERLPGYAPVFGLAHIPIDNIILGRLRQYGVPRLGTAWSRVGSYEVYMGIQQWVRTAFSGSAPLAVEFDLWLNAGGGVSGGAAGADDPTADPSGRAFDRDR